MRTHGDTLVPITAGQMANLVGQFASCVVPHELSSYRVQYLLQNSFWQGQLAGYLGGGANGLIRTMVGDLEPFEIKVPPLEVQLPIFKQIAAMAKAGGMVIFEKEPVEMLVERGMASGDDRLLLCNDFGNPLGTARLLTNCLSGRTAFHSPYHLKPVDPDLFDDTEAGGTRLQYGPGVDDFASARVGWLHDRLPCEAYLFRVADRVPIGGSLSANIQTCWRAHEQQVGMWLLGMLEPLWLLVYNPQGLFPRVEAQGDRGNVLLLAEWRFRQENCETGWGMIPGIRLEDPRTEPHDLRLDLWPADSVADFIGFAGMKVWMPDLHGQY